MRHPDAVVVSEVWERLEDAAAGAALGTGTEVEAEIIHGIYPVLVNETLARMMDEKLREVGGVEYNAQEQAFAEELHSTLVTPAFDVGSQETIQPYEVSIGFASTDVGDVSMAVPTVGLRVATWVPGTTSHSWQAAAASGTSIGFKGAHNAAKTLTLAAIELFGNEALREAARAEHREKRGPDFRYEPLLGDRDPPLDYRN